MKNRLTSLMMSCWIFSQFIPYSSCQRMVWLPVCLWGLKKLTVASPLTCLTRYLTSKGTSPLWVGHMALHRSSLWCNTVNKSYIFSFVIFYFFLKQAEKKNTFNSCVYKTGTTDRQKGWECGACQLSMNVLWLPSVAACHLCYLCNVRIQSDLWSKDWAHSRVTGLTWSNTTDFVTKSRHTADSSKSSFKCCHRSTKTFDFDLPIDFLFPLSLEQILFRMSRHFTPLDEEGTDGVENIAVINTLL